MNEYLAKLDNSLQEYLVKKAPPLGDSWKILLVKLAPWFAVIATIFGLPAILAVFGLGAMMTPFAWVAGARTGMFWFFWFIGLFQIGLSAMSIKPLFAKESKGWTLMFYSQLLSVLTALGHFNVVNLLLTILSFYLLYQIKSSYK